MIIINKMVKIYLNGRMYNIEAVKNYIIIGTVFI